MNRPYLTFGILLLLAGSGGCKAHRQGNSGVREISNGKVRLGQATVDTGEGTSLSQFLICDFNKTQCMNPFVYKPTDSSRYMRAQWVHFPYDSEEQVEKIERMVAPLRIQAKIQRDQDINQRNGSFDNAAVDKFKAEQDLSKTKSEEVSATSLRNQKERRVGVLRDDMKSIADSLGNLKSPNIQPEQLRALEVEIRDASKEIEVSTSKLTMKGKPDPSQFGQRKEWPLKDKGDFLCSCLFSDGYFTLYEDAHADRNTVKSCAEVGAFDPAVCRFTQVNKTRSSAECNCTEPSNVFDPSTGKLSPRKFTPSNGAKCDSYPEDPESCKNTSIAEVWQKLHAANEQASNGEKQALDAKGKQLNEKKAILAQYQRQLSEYRSAQSSYEARLATTRASLAAAERELAQATSSLQATQSRLPRVAADVSQAQTAFNAAKQAREVALAPFDLKRELKKLNIDPNVKVLAAGKDAYTPFGDAPSSDEWVGEGTIEDIIKAMVTTHGFSLNCRLDTLQQKLLMVIPPCQQDSEGERLFSDYQFTNLALGGGRFKHPMLGTLKLAKSEKGFEASGENGLEITATLEPCENGVCTEASKGATSKLKLGIISDRVVAMTLSSSGEVYLFDRLDSIDPGIKAKAGQTPTSGSYASPQALSTWKINVATDSTGKVSLTSSRFDQGSQAGSATRTYYCDLPSNACNENPRSNITFENLKKDELTIIYRGQVPGSADTRYILKLQPSH